MINKNVVGHVLENKDLHVCGYDLNKVIIQDQSNGISKPRKYTVKFTTNEGKPYFTLKGTKIFLPIVK